MSERHTEDFELELLSEDPAEGVQDTEAIPHGEIRGVVIGRLVGISEEGEAQVNYPGNPTVSALPAISTVEVTPEDSGREVALAFESGNPARPVVLGIVQNLKAPADSDSALGSQELDARVDGKRIVLSGEEQIVLKCGKASITLTRAGKVLIRGAYLLSRSSGANRIKGGSVQIN